MPGPHEPKHDINSFIEPLVDELLELWKGVKMDIFGIGETVVRCALLCVACDLPAGRKICGFLGCGARYGCSRCYKAFPGSPGNMDYSGFSLSTWQVRTGADHREKASKLKRFTTLAEQQANESKSGCRYSELLRLPYFDAPKMLIVDPMHNLFLGTAKHYLKDALIEKKLVADGLFDNIQERINSATVPTGIGRIPHKIQSGFSAFTADQWKNWVLYYSLLVLHDILDIDHLECWRHFVLACRALCCKELSPHQLQLGHGLLLQFCKRAERLYGKQFITPNMHMHMHLKSCVTDFGPLHGFWLYAFERYNGILGSVPNNNRSIEVQLMTRFQHDNEVLSVQLPKEFSETFASEFSKLRSTQSNVGSVADSLISSSQTDITPISHWTVTSDMELPSYHSKHIIGVTYYTNLQTLYSELYHVPISSIQMPTSCWKYSSVAVRGKQLGSFKGRSASSSIVMASWKTDLFGQASLLAVDNIEAHLEGHDQSEITRAARIDAILFHKVTINKATYPHLLVSLSWFKFHRAMFKLGKPLTVWCPDLFEDEGIHSIIPIQFVKNRTVSTISRIEDESVLTVCPCIDF